MTEATLTRELLRVLERKLSGAVVIKHADRFQIGVPDASVTWGGTTSWLEVKYVRRDFRESGHATRLFPRQFPTAQLVTMEQLAAAGSAVYLIYFGRRLLLWHPIAIANSTRHGVLVLPHERWNEVYPGGFYEEHHATFVADDAELVAFFRWLHERRE
jgi:hypothetical protein